MKLIEIIETDAGRIARVEGVGTVSGAGAIFVGHDKKETVIKLIRKKYDQNDELGIIRQRDDKTDEFNEYNAYVEACKAVADEIHKPPVIETKTDEIIDDCGAAEITDIETEI